MPPEAPRTSTWTDREESNNANAATATASRSTTNSACPPGGTCADPTAANCSTAASVGGLGVTAYACPIGGHGPVFRARSGEAA